MKLTEFKLNEALFSEAVPQDTIDYIFQGTNIDKVHRRTLDMIKNPYKKYGTDPYTGQRAEHVMQQEAFILLRLYELTVLNPNNAYAVKSKAYTDPFTGELFDPGYGVKKSDLLRMSGAANPDTVGEGGTYWGDFKHIGLAYDNIVKDMPNYIFPGSRLEPYVKGALTASQGAQFYNRETKQLEPFTNDASDPNPKTRGQSMEDDIGKLADRPRKTPSASKTRNPQQMPANPFANIPGIKVRPQPQKKDPTEDDPYAGFGPKTVEEQPIEERPAAEIPVEEKPIIEKPVATNLYKRRNIDFTKFKKRGNTAVGESLKEDFELVDDAYLLKDTMDLVDKAKVAYRSWRGLEPGADLTNEYNPYDFKALCCCNRWPITLRVQIWPERTFE